ncbi:MAG: hypothetical protein J2P46_09710 [Zavarzinella sp.]|nr:hypothetical protein [Zavarzinella sp.]
MDLLVRLTQVNGHYSASLLGDPEVRAEAPTQEEAIEGLRRQIQEQVDRSEILAVRIDDRHPVTAMAGILRDDPTLDEMIAEIYRQRDEERIREHGQ